MSTLMSTPGTPSVENADGFRPVRRREVGVPHRDGDVLVSHEVADGCDRDSRLREPGGERVAKVVES